MGFLRISKGKYGLNIHLNILNLNLIFRLYKSFNTEQTVGIRNSTEDGKRLIFLDYDNMLYQEQLIPELKWLQKTYKLSDFYIFKSSQKPGAYHVICLDKLTSREWIDIIEKTNVDQNYKKVPIFVDNKAWVLRFLPKAQSKKPELIHILKSKHQQREKSKAHALFLKYNYGININKIKNLDKHTNVLLTLYDTLNYIKTKDEKTTTKKQKV